jgi:outer membrane protein OmpA-like peptidoglycan-associated protein
MRFRAAALLLAILPGAAGAISLDLPASASMQTEELRPADSFALPVGAFAEGVIPTQNVEGDVSFRTWRIDSPGLTTLQILSPLRQQLSREGFETLFECRSDQCGGFDFRFGTEVVPAPAMFVDLADFRFLSARHKTGSGPEYIALMISRSARAGFLQVVQVGSAPAPARPAELPPPAEAPVSFAGSKTAALADLAEVGRVVLGDLTFASGSADLDDTVFASLKALASLLADNQSWQIALVGHTDATGSADANLLISQRRAEAVKERLVMSYETDGSRIEAAGAGYLAPIASNLTQEGRAANRRVEVVLLAAE